MGPFYGWVQLPQLFTTKFPEIPGTHTGPLDWESSALTTVGHCSKSVGYI